MKRPSHYGAKAPVAAATQVAGELIINDCRYVVVFEEPSAGPVAALGRFEIAGRRCAVVAADAEGGRPRVDPAELLTERELQIATLVALGRPNKQIADRLNISEWTVSTHLRRIFAKLGVESRAAMVYLCASLIKHDGLAS
jgi:DNA-binding CsgD family transcriptional regulator